MRCNVMVCVFVFVIYSMNKHGFLMDLIVTNCFALIAIIEVFCLQNL
jgi:hypothetical protein